MQKLLFDQQTSSRREAQAARISDVLAILWRECDLFQHELEKFAALVRRRAHRNRITDEQQVLAAIAEGRATVTAISHRTLIPYHTVSAIIQQLLRKGKIDQGVRKLERTRHGGAWGEFIYVVGTGKRVRRKKSTPPPARTAALFNEHAQ